MINLEDFCRDFKECLREKGDFNQVLPRGRELVTALAANKEWYQGVLARVISDDNFLLKQGLSLESNEILIYRDPDRSFSIRAYLWERGHEYTAHDHGSWGIISGMVNSIRETKYKRLDGGVSEGVACIEKTAERKLNPGETTFVLPLNEGLHKLEAAEELDAVSLHVYGRPVRTERFINYYYPEKNEVKRIYPPILAQRMLAIRTAATLSPDWARDLFKEALEACRDKTLQERCVQALNNL